MTFECSVCGKEYQRNTHLRRHESTHAENGRFSCPYCTKAFARRDVCRKHATSCLTKGNNRGRPSHEVQTIKRGQKPRACDACAHSKLACDLAEPCGRCVSRHSICSYNKVQRDPSNASGMDPLRIRKPYTRDAQARLSIPFLLSMTDPKAETMIKSFFCEPMREAEIGGTEFDPEREFFPWNITDILMGDVEDELDLYDLFNQVPDIDHSSPALDARLAFIVAELGAVHARLSAMDASYSETFSIDSAKQVFTARNAKLFVSTFFRYTQPDFPVAHVASFSYEESSLELLLALILMGSMRAVPRDDALSTHTFFRVGEEYIFQRLREVVALEPRQKLPSKRVIEVLLAALNIHSMRALVNDKKVRRRTRTENLPVIVATIRSLGLLQMKHDNLPEDTPWDDFIRVETCIRLAAWAALIDWSQCGTFNSPPIIASAEMTGDFPCSEELWSAADATEFRLMASREAEASRSRTSLSHCLAVLMQDGWLGASHFPLEPVTLMNLYFLIGGLSASIVSARLMSTLSASAPVILSAIERWQELWDRETMRLGPEKVRASGLFRHSGGVAWLVRRSVEVSIGNGQQCAYTKGVDHDSLKELHDFLQMCRDT
ncbi:Transcription factor 1 like protein [Verticillium longisporum]|uniref:Transcription factor 1 like protein n=1 Tax=Verticillium longisporum TaxID=100787 RepID=A0A8I2Z6R8_VERLO|nr:Transcription factor 1 like protein [Verticillium longisporum]